jgi:hypothetical protein
MGKTIAIAALLVVLGAILDREFNRSQCTDTVLRLASEIKRGFIS